MSVTAKRLSLLAQPAGKLRRCLRWSERPEEGENQTKTVERERDTITLQRTPCTFIVKRMPAIDFFPIQSWTKELAIGYVNSPPAARGNQEAGFMQPCAHSFTLYIGLRAILQGLVWGKVSTGLGKRVVPRLRESRLLTPSGRRGASSHNLGPGSFAQLCKRCSHRTHDDFFD